MAVSMPDLFKISVEGQAVSPARTELVARGHLVPTDEPKERGGTDLSATPLETMLSSFLGCTNVITHFVAGRSGIKISNMELALEGHFDTRGVFGKADVRLPFPKIILKVKMESNANSEQLRNLKEEVAQKCPVSVILREAGCVIEEEWTNTQLV